MGSRKEKKVPTESWQLDCKQWLQQNQYLLKNEHLADSYLIVGKGEDCKTFGCHKLLLAKASPVFEVMLYRPIDEGGTQDIEISDVTPQIFQVMLKFLYVGTYEYLEFDMALQLVYLTEKYMLGTLQRLAVDNLMLQLRVNNVITLYEFCSTSDTYIFQNLRQRAWQMILMCTDQVIVAESFLNAKKTTVKSIMLQDSLTINDESDLIEACDKWAQHQTKCSQDTKCLRVTLGEIFTLFRFLTVRTEHFSVIDSVQMLTEDEKIQLKYAILNHTNQSMRLFESIDQEVIERGYYQYNEPTFIDIKCITNYGSKFENQNVNINVGFIDSLSFKPDSDVALVGIETKSIALNGQTDKDSICIITIKEERGAQVFCGGKKIICDDTKNNGPFTTTVCMIFENPLLLTRYRTYNILTICKKGKLYPGIHTQKKCEKLEDFVETKYAIEENSLIKALKYYKIF